MFLPHFDISTCCISFALREKQKYQVANVRVKSKIVTFASQSVIEFKQFLTKPNLICSVAKNDRRFFSVLIFHETISKINIDIKTHLNE